MYTVNNFLGKSTLYFYICYYQQLIKFINSKDKKINYAILQVYKYQCSFNKIDIVVVSFIDVSKRAYLALRLGHWSDADICDFRC